MDKLFFMLAFSFAESHIGDGDICGIHAKRFFEIARKEYPKLYEEWEKEFEFEGDLTEEYYWKDRG